MQALLDRLRGDAAEPDCRCTVDRTGDTLTVDATECDGRLADAPACRATVAGALRARDVERIRVRSRGVDRFYDDAAVALLSAAGRFAALVRTEDPALADRARTRPLAAAADAAARAPPIDEIARETGLLDAADAGTSPLDPAVAPSIADARVTSSPPRDARLREARELSTGATVRIYDVPGDGAATYHLEPVAADLSASTLATLADAYELLAEREDEPAPVEAVRAAVDGAEGSTAEGVDGAWRTAERDDSVPVRTLASVLHRHTRGYGILEDCFADPAVSDVYASGPASGTPLWVVADGEQLRTNVALGEEGAAAVASKLRRTSGRSFSRASPTLDASARIAGKQVRVAGVLDPATRGHAFAFRSGGEGAFTLPALVANGTLPPAAAALCSVAVRRDAAVLIAGTRGAGKTTTLGALCWELPATTRTVVVEDTPELPVATLQEHGRDVQPLQTTLEEGPGISPTDALRTALRLGEGAIVLGEVRGEEAAVLYEAMRVGASGEAVLGTIHGDGAGDVRERVVGDLGIPESSFAATDLVVTCELFHTPDGDRARRVAAIEEVVASGADELRFEPLFELAGESDAPTGAGRSSLAPTGRIDRGNSRLLQRLATPGESYAAVRELVADRAAFLGGLADRGTTSPGPVTTSYARRGDRR